MLEKVECKTLARLIIANGMLKTFQLMAAKDLTIFAPIGKSPSPASALGPVMSLSPAPALAPSPVFEASSSVKDMPPAPSSMETPSTLGTENSRSDNGADHVKGSAGMAVLVTGCATLISSLMVISYLFFFYFIFLLLFFELYFYSVVIFFLGLL